MPHNKLIPQWALDADKQIGLPGTSQSLFFDFDKLFIRLRLEPAGGRDMLVRGKPHQAVASLSKLENQLDRLLDQFHKGSYQQVSYFRESLLKPVLQKYAELRLAAQQMNALPKDSKEARDAQLKCGDLLMQLQAVWKDQNVKSMVSNLGADWAIPELREHLTYFMGLAKMDLAIRDEMKFLRNPKIVWPVGTPTPSEQFAAAPEWFRRYEAMVIPMKTNVWLDAVKLRHEECREHQAKLEKLTAQLK